MAYTGKLLKIGDYEIPQSFMKEGYSVYENSQVLEPWLDADGYEHLDYVKLEAVKVEFETPAMLTDEQFWEVYSQIKAQLFKGRKCYITAYIPTKHKNVTQLGYMVDIQPTIYGTYNGVIHYNSIRFAFVGGVADD